MSARDRRAVLRRLYCDRDPTCAATCGKCRARIHRERQTLDSVTDPEFRAWCAHVLATAGDAGDMAELRRFVHSLRRHNEPYRGETKLNVRADEWTLDHVRERADRAGLSVQDYVTAAVLRADPADMRIAWAIVREEDLAAVGQDLWTRGTFKRRRA